MWPPGHLAVGYLAYTLVCRLLRGRPPEPAPTVVLAIATQFPDLVDKPLSWSFGLLPTGRSLTHSVVTVTVLTALVYRYARSVDRPALGSAFAIGYASHILGDLYAAIAAGDDESNWFWLWPFVPQEGYVTRPSFRMYVEAAGLAAIALLAYVGVFAVVTGVVWQRGKTSDRTFTAFVVVVVATSAILFLSSSFGSPTVAFELVLVQAAVALWVRDGAPGVPHFGAWPAST